MHTKEELRAGKGELFRRSIVALKVNKGASNSITRIFRSIKGVFGWSINRFYFLIHGKFSLK